MIFMKEEDIRPKNLMQRYLELAEKDAYICKNKELVEVTCPGCGSEASEHEFIKYGFTYVRCDKCSSLYCSPRPTESALIEYYEKGASIRYFSETLFPATSKIRRKKIYQDKATKIEELFRSRRFSPKSICDVGAGQGIFLEELSALFRNAEFYAIEPNSSLASQCREKNFITLESTAENSMAWNDCFDFVVSTEVLEHSFSLPKFVQALYRLTKKEGGCLVTGIGAEGFDMLTLGEDASNVYPPAHINFLSIEGAYSLFSSTGFRNVEVWTPGELDTDIVLSSGVPNDFIATLAKRGETAMSEFQEFLRKHKLSSHLWMVGRK